MAIRRTKREVSKEEFDKFIFNFPRPLKFDGVRYTEDAALRGGTWRKPVAAVVDDKFFIVEDV